MTPRTPSRRTTPLCGRTESPNKRHNSLYSNTLQSLKRLKFRDLFRLRSLAAAVAVAAAAGCGQGHSRHVELVMGSSVPTPGTTFELRFESAMVKDDQVGLVLTNSPLVIQPALGGTFTWLSTRSGVFTPTEPLALDASYKLSLRPELQCADGRKSDASLDQTVTTPEFGLIAATPHHADSNATSQPEIKLVFNADIRAADVEKFLCFRDNSGNQITADARQGTVDELWSDYEFGGRNSLRTWKQDADAIERFGKDKGEEDAPEDSTNELGHFLVVSPHTALPIGNQWRLLVPEGLLATDPRMHTHERHEVPVGDVTPFTVNDVRANNYLGEGPGISIEFSKPIPETLTNSFADWVDLSQVPTNLQVQVSGRVLSLSGNFHGGTDCTIKLHPGFASTEPFTLEGEHTFTVTVPHVPARIYFPALSRDQQAGGNRMFPMISVNVPNIRVRAKLMDPQTAVHALRGYASYFMRNQPSRSYDWSEPFRAIDYNVIPGHTIFDKTFHFGPNEDISDISQKKDLHWDDLLNGQHTGVVFLDARRADDDDSILGSQALIQLTDLGMLWKKSPAGVDVFVFSQNSGEPVAGATTLLMDNENESLTQATTDTNGLAHLMANTNAEWIAVQHGQDFHALPLKEGRIWNYPFNLPYFGFDEREDTNRVMLFSDRDLYRPGEEMHFEALVRNWTGSQLAVIPGLAGTLECTDSQGHKFFQTNAVFSSIGSWSTLVPLRLGSRGFYSATLRLGTNASYQYSFQVQDFQPNAFEISLPCKESYRAGESIELPLSARYMFGKKLSRAQVAWSLEASDTPFSAEGFGDFQFARDGMEVRYGRGRSSVSLTGHGMLTGTSNLIIAPTLSANPAAPQPRSVSFLAEVTDVNQQTLSQRADFLWHSSDFYLGMKRGKDIFTSATNPAIELLAVGADGKPWPETVKGHLALQRADWQTVRVQGAGKTVRFHNEMVFSNILERDISIPPVPAPTELTKAKGNPIEDLPPLSAGEYLLEVKAEDSAGRPIASSLSFRVAAPGETSWNYRNEIQLNLKPDHESYAPGNSAEILLEAPFSGTALVSVEREKVLRSFVTHVDGNAPSIHVPLEPGDVPNVSVSVTLMRGAENSPHKSKEPEYRTGSCQLLVTNSQNLLNVSITPTNNEYLPGHPVDAAVSVMDSTGQPVSGAEVVLYAVDDGILGITAYTLPDPHGFFYAPRPVAVQSSISLPNLLSEDPEELSYENKGYLGGGGGEDGRVRKKFLACAFWNATLLTDSEGKVRAHFVAPDSLTRYRLLAVAHTADCRFGSAQEAFRVSKPLVIEPALPSIASITDHLTARAVVLNQTTNTGTVIVTLELDGKAKAFGPDLSLSRSISIAANGSVPVEFPIEFKNVGESSWTWKARFADGLAGNFNDAVQSTISVGHIAPVLGETLLARATNADTDLIKAANPQLLGGNGTIMVKVANTRLNELAGSVSELLHYPYGCAEQTGSSMLPWILLRDLPGLLPNPRAGTNDPDAAIRVGIARFMSMQTESGGLGYWPHAKEPMLWASAYGGMVLALAQRHGTAVPKQQFDSLMEYLSRELRRMDTDTSDLADGCLAAYALALAGHAEPAYHEKLFSMRAKLSSENRALLALAIAEAHGPRQMMVELLKVDTRPNWDRQDDSFDCPAREQAVRLLAWIFYRPDDPMVDRLVEDLMHEQKNANWGTTQGNAWALLALTEYAARVELKREPTDGQLTFAGQTLPFHLDERTNVFTHTFAFTNRADATLRLVKASTNRLYSTIFIEARPQETPQPRQDRGFSLQRRYDRLDDDNQPQGTDGLQVGDRVLVTLQLSVRERAHYMVIDDPLPSILEAINPEFRTQEARPPNAVADDSTWWFSDFREIRKGRCLSFADRVEPGTYVMRYVARVRAAGSVTAPSAKAEEMYHPEKCGLSETQALVSKGLN